jgi:hypothetical protein
MYHPAGHECLSLSLHPLSLPLSHISENNAKYGVLKSSIAGCLLAAVFFSLISGLAPAYNSNCTILYIYICIKYSRYNV